MEHEEAKVALMGDLDGELDAPRRRALEAHLAGCEACRREAGRMRSLKEVTATMRLREPSDREWDEYWGGMYNRMERGLGWIFVSAGAIVLISFGLIQWVKALLEEADLPWYVRGGIFVLAVGLVIMLVSVVRERLFLYRREPYREVKR